MRHLPLYPDRRLPLDHVEGIDRTSACTRCSRHEDARTVCMSADGKAVGGSFSGAVLVVGGQPTREEDHAGRPFSTAHHQQLRALVEGNTHQPVVYTNALGCWAKPAKKSAVPQADIAACRPYLRAVADEAQPSRILCFGREAFESVLGVDTPAKHCRRGYGHTEDGTPVFMLPRPSSVLSNKFLSARFKADVRWALRANPDPAPFNMQVQMVDTAADAAVAVAALRAGRFWTFDTETAGLMGSKYFEVLCLAACPEDAQSVFVWDAAALSSPDVRQPLLDVLADERAPMVGHNLKYDLEAVAVGLGLRAPDTGEVLARGVHGDTLLWTKMIDTEVNGRLEYQDARVGMSGHKAQNKASLEKCVEAINVARGRPQQRYFERLCPPPLAAAVRHPTVDAKAFAFGLVERETLHRYCALDTVSTARLALLMEPTINREDHHRLTNNVFIRPSTQALAQVETWGMSADAEAARLAGQVLKIERDQALARIRALGCTVENIGSDTQLREYLYGTKPGQLGLPILGYTDSGLPSTKAALLKELRDQHPVIEPLLLHAKVDKLITTYADGLIPHIRNGRIYTNIRQDGTRSGRWSSANPNLQNIPSGGRWAKLIKNVFNAPPGHVLIQLDYSQLELRIAAMLTGDPQMIQIYKDGLDFHQRTAELIAPQMWGIDPSMVTPDHRRGAKTFNFGVWYGTGDGTIAKNLKVSRQVAAKLRYEVLGQFAKAGPWIDQCKADARKTGITWTYWDGKIARVRQLPDIDSHDDSLVSKAANGSFNTRVQGTAAQYMERTIQAVVDWILSDGIPARVTNTVHDSIILEVPFEWAVEVIEVVRDIMESWPSGPVPLVADAELGMAWGGLYDFKLVRQCAAGRPHMNDAELCRVVGLLDKETGKPQLDVLTRVLRLAEAVGLL